MKFMQLLYPGLGGTSTVAFSSIFYGVRSLFTQEHADVIQLSKYKNVRH